MVKRDTLIARDCTHEVQTELKELKCHRILYLADMLLTRAGWQKGLQLCHKVKYVISSVHAMFSRAKHKITRCKQI